MSNTEDEHFAPTKLVPVSEWVWNRYEVRYYRRDPIDEMPADKTHYLVSTDTHVDYECAERCPHGWWYTWEMVAGDVKTVRVVPSQIAGMRAVGAGWEDYPDE